MRLKRHYVLGFLCEFGAPLWLITRTPLSMDIKAIDGYIYKLNSIKCPLEGSSNQTRSDETQRETFKFQLVAEV